MYKELTIENIKTFEEEEQFEEEIKDPF